MYNKKEVFENMKSVVDQEYSKLPESVQKFLTSAAYESVDLLMGGAGGKQSISKCQSPVEQIFYIVANQSSEYIIQEIDSDYLYMITPQVKIGNYRVDFLAEIFSLDYIEIAPLVKIIIEIDGHEFHEKTKKQAARDKKRDRDLSEHCDAILHFTGSEIFNAPYSAIVELKKMLISKYKEKILKKEV